jgi:hypothetical protein
VSAVANTEVEIVVPGHFPGIKDLASYLLMGRSQSLRFSNQCHSK